jgi:hypothetical protein
MTFVIKGIMRAATWLVCLSLLLPLYPIKASAQQKRVIIVNADQPNVWTLEQAHYLLAQMHRRNLDLRAKSLTDLDPNEINGLRFDVFRQLIEAGAEFNQADLANNRLISSDQKFNAARRQSLLTRRDKLQEDSLSLTRDISELQTAKAGAITQEDKDSLDAKISAKTAERAAVDKQVEQINDELKTLNAPSGSLKATEAEAGFDANKLPKSIFDKAFEDAAKKQIEKFNESPQLNATLRLENFLQMQYEIIAKQLTLLRDEVGPGERLLFLELPQTVNVTHHESDRKWAQSWWRIVGYTKQKKGTDPKEYDPNRNERPVSTLQKMQDIMAVLKKSRSADDKVKSGDDKVASSDDKVEYVDLESRANSAKIYTDKTQQSEGVQINDRTVRTVDLIPRQSSLNVNDMKLKTNAGAFTGVASFLFGFGARLNVQRQREQFSQFVQQELYSSAFGKGSREFGWTFTPMPGTDRLLSGVRTTYAVVIVPEEATSIVVESNGCYFPRSAYQPNDFDDTKDASRWGDSRTSRGCGSSQAFVVPIPGGVDGSNDFWVRGLSFQPVGKGKRIVVLISGSNFSSQIGVLINGVPLTQSIGLAQPLIRDDSKAGAEAVKDANGENIHGRVERIDANKIVASFEMPPDFKGTPTITLIAPGRAVDLNWITLGNINDKKNIELVHYPTEMFGHSPSPSGFRIDSVRVFRGRSYGMLTALINGAGFLNTGTNPPSPAVARVIVNGNWPAQVTFESQSLLRVEFTAPSDETIKFTLVSRNDDQTKVETIESDAVANPARLSISGVEVITYEPAAEDEPATLVVKINGTGFTDKLRASVGELAVKSATEAVLTLTNPKTAAIVTLTDDVTGQTVKTVITRKTRSPD